jgi:ribosomal protein L19E
MLLENLINAGGYRIWVAHIRVMRSDLGNARQDVKLVAVQRRRLFFASRRDGFTHCSAFGFSLVKASRSSWICFSPSSSDIR